MEQSIPLSDTMSFSEASPGTESEFLTKDDVTQAGVIVTVLKFTQHNFAKENEEPELKPVVHWAEAAVKPMACNKGNWNVIGEGCATLGDAKGKQFVVYNDPNVKFGDKVVGGLRIRPHLQPQAAGPVQDDNGGFVPS